MKLKSNTRARRQQSTVPVDVPRVTLTYRLTGTIGSRHHTTQPFKDPPGTAPGQEAGPRQRESLEHHGAAAPLER